MKKITRAVAKSSILKNNYISYLRYKKQTPFISTECGKFYSDILYILDSNLIEVEIKTSMKDFLNDFKKPKHSIYSIANKENKNRMERLVTQDAPNYFYYGVPADLVPQIKEYLSENGYTKYGILTISDTIYPTDKLIPILRKRSSTITRVAKKATKLHTAAVRPEMEREIIRRLASELCTKQNQNIIMHEQLFHLNKLQEN